MDTYSHTCLIQYVTQFVWPTPGTASLACASLAWVPTAPGSPDPQAHKFFNAPSQSWTSLREKENSPHAGSRHRRAQRKKSLWGTRLQIYATKNEPHSLQNMVRSSHRVWKSGHILFTPSYRRENQGSKTVRNLHSLSQKKSHFPRCIWVSSVSNLPSPTLQAYRKYTVQESKSTL